ncbi:unnamed protein product [Symbiodinium natans]|uniref:Uncharacterized protein n=1 Tax=Symbiodinium natans TaxID=878477 RepID=A0A812TDG4_9DINO|nr:unnamed protein product [Symbiodinium natans]
MALRSWFRFSFGGTCHGCPRACHKAAERSEDRAWDEAIIRDPNLDGIISVLPEPAGCPKHRQLDAFWNSFQGWWYRQEDNECVGEIFRDSMIWHPQWKMPEKETCLEMVAQDTIMQDLRGHVLMGSVLRDAQMSICWSNGDVWLLK